MTQDDSPKQADPSPMVAAVDLGSNSFHMIVARTADTHFDVLDRIRERVALAAGLDRDRRLTAEALTRALSCLERLGQRLRGLPSSNVRVVGTNTLRQAKNSTEFIAQAQTLLGHPIEVISGREEARLIYLGVSHTLPETVGRRLVIDIGGGSTEVIIGENFEPIQMDSLYMGCVSSSLKHFPDGRIRKEDFRHARIAAHLEFESIRRQYKTLGWNACVGSSGTILAVEQILRENGWSDTGITRKGLRKLKKAMVEMGHVNKLELKGIPQDRAPVLPGGVAILLAAFESLDIDRMEVSTGALREGLLYDLLGRIRHEDVRDHAIRRFCERYRIDLQHASRVERTAIACLDQAALGWGLDREWARPYMVWASRLHEVGLSVTYSGYQKHSAYLVTHADLPGFSRQDQELLATIILGHRRKIPQEIFKDMGSSRGRTALRLCLLLRLAVRLNRSRSETPHAPFALQAVDTRLSLTFPPEWLEEHPLTRADLEEEAVYFKTAGVELSAQ